MPSNALSLAMDFPPFSDDLSNNAFAFYRATSLSYSDGFGMTAWADLSPNARDLVINSGSPTFRIIGGKGCVSFDGGDDAFQNTNFDLNGVSEISLHLVSAYNANQGDVENDGPIFIDETGSWGKLFLGAQYNSIQWRFGTGLLGNNQSYNYTPPGAGVFTTISLIRTLVSGNVTERLWVNGVLADTKNLGSTNTTLANLATTLRMGKGAYFSNQYIRGFAIYTYNTESNRADIEAALS
ncbi:hypothetical protein [Floridanema evergladense]|uniref:Uncharacterized protein n=1 Tax=Floridaenema evergladense BLCC-F167 TaxID=3153639 RepID=A0ABV4WCZ5_9CYAN